MSDGNASAFPVSAERNDEGMILHGSEAGLTKREYFAAMAMQGMMVNLQPTSDADRPRQLAAFASRAVAASDALLAELEKPR